MAHLDPKIKAQMINSATEARRHSHSPYSGFKVGASVLMDNGKVYGGCNVENASYGLTNCAERTAIFAAVAAGARKVECVAIHASTPTPTAPCGACRQVIHEFGPEARVLLDNGTAHVVETTLSALLPAAFGPADLA